MTRTPSGVNPWTTWRVPRRHLTLSISFALLACSSTSIAFCAISSSSGGSVIHLGAYHARWNAARSAGYNCGSGRHGVSSISSSCSTSWAPRRRDRWSKSQNLRSELRMTSSLGAELGEMFKVPDERILKAVEKAGNRAVPSDVATLAGVDIGVAKASLVDLAAMVGGDLEVSKDGDVVYKFPSNIRGILLQRSAYRRVVKSAQQAWPLVFYGIRVTFGVTLLASIALIFSTIFVAATVSSGENDRRDREGGSSGPQIGFNFFGPTPFDFFYYSPYGMYRPYQARVREDSPGQRFVEACFSYVFGDGDPNRELEKGRIARAAEFIRQSGGAVVAEQLAPLLAPAGARSEDGPVDESFMLPVLTALDGFPEVTDGGDIVYMFPTLQTSAMEGGTVAGVEARARLDGLKATLPGKWTQELLDSLSKFPSLSNADLRQCLEAIGVSTRVMLERAELLEAANAAGLKVTSDGVIRQELRQSQPRNSRMDPIPEPLQEQTIEFTSEPSGFFRGAAMVLGGVNLGGALYLQRLLSGPQLAGVTLPGFFGFVQAAMPFLLTYAVLYNVIPLVRWGLLRRKNDRIRERNAFRTAWAIGAQRAGAAMERKLKATKSMRQAVKVIKASDVEYTTAKNLSEQGAEDTLLDDFDKRLKTAQDPSKPE